MPISRHFESPLKITTFLKNAFFLRNGEEQHPDYLTIIYLQCAQGNYWSPWDIKP